MAFNANDQPFSVQTVKQITTKNIIELCIITAFLAHFEEKLKTMLKVKKLCRVAVNMDGWPYLKTPSHE